jgi:hypothetical protein
VEHRRRRGTELNNIRISNNDSFLQRLCEPLGTEALIVADYYGSGPLVYIIFELLKAFLLLLLLLLL